MSTLGKWQWSAGLEELSVERSIALTCPHEPHQDERFVSKPTEGSHEQSSETGYCKPNYGTAADPGTSAQAEDWLLPITDTFSKRRQFAVDSFGRVHLIVGASCSFECEHTRAPPVSVHMVACMLRPDSCS